MKKRIEKKRMSPRTWKRLKYLLAAMPLLILVTAFCYVPLFGWSYAFTDFKLGVPLLKMDFVGLKNFAKMLAEKKELFRVLRNTLVMSGLGLLFSPLPVIFAILLNEIRFPKLKKTVQTLTTLPNFISWIVMFGLAFSLFSTDGMLNRLLLSLGQEPLMVSILGNNRYTWIFQWMLGTWKSLGWSAIIYLAAISGIDGELYDAAKVDGCNRWKCILHVTVPGVMETFLVMQLLNIGNILNNGFEQYYMFWNSMVSDKIEVLDYYVYQIAFRIGDYSYSIALGMIKSLISIVLLFMVNRLAKKIRGTAII